MFFITFRENHDILDFFLLENQTFFKMYIFNKSHINYFVSILCKKAQNNILSPKKEPSPLSSSSMVITF